jgi:oxygen-independent coproporphyrinogen-3 oxidase
MTGLRTMWGIAIKDLEDKFSEALVAYFIRECEPKLQNKILINEKGVIKLHPSQLFYADGIASDLFFVP